MWEVLIWWKSFFQTLSSFLWVFINSAYYFCSSFSFYVYLCFNKAFQCWNLAFMCVSGDLICAQLKGVFELQSAKLAYKVQNKHFRIRYCYIPQNHIFLCLKQNCTKNTKNVFIKINYSCVLTDLSFSVQHSPRHYWRGVVIEVRLDEYFRYK